MDIRQEIKRQVPGCGDSLFLVVEPIGKGGGKSFMGVMRFPPCSPKNGGKRVEYRIGPYGKGVGKWSLKEARNEWERVRTWSRENNRDPRELKKDEQQIQVQDSSGPTFAEACKSYLSHSSSKASKKEYPNLLNHQVIPRLRWRYSCCALVLGPQGNWRKERQGKGDGDIPVQGC